ncbi:Hypothetical protein CINCED_3A004082 [Cinara cedri]|uniref:Uncharacterized protein n=1 Tax=Cinara cedri TaxID=506608 RepID=A0A5E4M2A7_9HEMI|nr:Hypothetical protein CINCED_3A004082 [Cinara cedri]
MPNIEAPRLKGAQRLYHSCSVTRQYFSDSDTYAKPIPTLIVDFTFLCKNRVPNKFADTTSSVFPRPLTCSSHTIGKLQRAIAIRQTQARWTTNF